MMCSGEKKNLGILAMDIYFPSYFVCQEELGKQIVNVYIDMCLAKDSSYISGHSFYSVEKYDGVSKGKYTVGLGQRNMSVCPPDEDIVSMCLTVVKSLVCKYGIKYSDIGRLEVGTETIIDKSKSVKSYLMQLFNENGAFDVEGVDVKNACYGGSAAFFNTVAWMESSAWDGRYGLVVAGDIAVYAPGPARPTGGSGVVAILVGPDAPIVLENTRASYMSHVFDFFKPNLLSDFPVVDGRLSLVSYFEALVSCYRLFVEKSSKLNGEAVSMDSFDFLIFHSPFGKLVQKAFARLMLDDVEHGRSPKGVPANISSFDFEDKGVENLMIEASKDAFLEKSFPSLLCSRELGNIYCGSLFAGLLSILCQFDSLALV